MDTEKTPRRELNDIKISIVLPTFNERENVDELYAQLMRHITPLHIGYELLFVDDNSPDRTIDAVKALRRKDANVKYLLMSRRVGDQISLMAGVEHATGDIIVIMDSDLQHPPRYIPRMVEKWQEHNDIVIMQRQQEGHHSFFKKWSEILFYKMLNSISNTPIFYRFSGFALIDKKVALALRQFRERDPFLRGLVALVGFNKTELHYREDERQAGDSKYHLFDMIKLAVTGITSFSDAPLYASFYMGLLAIAVSLLYAVYVLVETFITNTSVPGWASTILVVIFIGGIQLLSTGVIGIFLSKVFLETKRRPRYIVQETAGFDHE